MKKSHITIPAFFIFLIIQLFLTVGLRQAQPTPGEGENTEIGAATQKPAIYFENQDFNFGKANKWEKIEYIY